jgi:aspartyl protease family protein
VSIERIAAFAVGVVLLSLLLPRVAPELIARWTAATQPAETVAAQSPVSAPATPAPAELAPAPQPVPGYGRQVALSADRNGHYLAEATVNGITVKVMVDTGATTVALSADTALRLGIAPGRAAYRLPIATANGSITAAPVTIDHIRLGQIDVYNVQAIVMPPGALSIDLLGMSFLSKLSRFEAAGGQLVLVQ